MTGERGRLRIRGISPHFVCGNAAVLMTIITPLLDLISTQAGTISMTLAGFFLSLAVIFGLNDLLQGGNIPPQRQYFLGIHIVFGFGMSLVVGYAISRWQGSELPDPLIIIDIVVACIVSVTWWLGRKSAHRSAFASLFRQIRD